MDCSTPGLPVHHQLPEFTQTHIHWVGDAIRPSHPLSVKRKVKLSPLGLDLSVKRYTCQEAFWAVLHYYKPHFIFFLFYFIFKLYNIVLVLPNIEMNPPQEYLCSTSWTLLPPPSPFHPSGSSQCTSPKHPVSCIEPGLATRFIYYMILYMFQCHSPKSPHPLPLPQSP